MLYRILTIIALLFLWSCGEDPLVRKQVRFHFDHLVDGQPLNLNSLEYTNESGNSFSVEKLQYLISRIELINDQDEIFELADYTFIDVNDESSLSLTPSQLVPEGSYRAVRFNYGFNEADNLTGEYSDLNLLSWNWPDMLGGGYHIMKLEGKFIDSDQNTTGFATHMGTAREIDGAETYFHDNHIEVELKKEFTITVDTQITISMELLNWYENPNTWDLNKLGSGIMPNYEAQVMLNQNGNDVFSLGSISPIE